MAGNKNQAAVPEPFVRRHRSFFVALFIFIPVIVMPAAILFTLLKSDLLQKWSTLYVICENSQSLKNGNLITMSGNTIGYVKRVDLIKEKEVCVRFDIRSEYKHLVKRDTRARLKQRGFVGDWEIELSGGSAAAALVTEGDTLKADNTSTIDGIIEKAVNLLDTAAILLSELMITAKELNTDGGTIGRLIKDDGLYKQISEIGISTLALTSDARKIAGDARGTLGKADSMISTLTETGAAVGAGGGALIDSLMLLVATVNKSFGDIEAILKNLKSVSADAPELMDKLNDNLEDVELMMRSLQNNRLFRKAAGLEAPLDPSLLETP